MTRSGYLPRVQGRAVHLTPSIDLVRSGQDLIIRYFPHPVRGHLKPHISPVVAFFSVLCSFSGTVGATTLSEAQLAAHTHSTTAALCGAEGQYRYGANNQLVNNLAIWATYAGASQSHTHPLSGASGQASTLPPYHALAFIMRIA